MRDKLEIVTYATHNERYFPILVESAKRNNLKLTVLGYGKKWNGFTDKFIGVLNYIKNKDPNLIVMFVDAFDVVFNNTTEQEILNKYNSFNKPIVFSVDMKNNYFFPKGFSKTINTGLYIGRVAYLNELLNNLMKFNVDEHNYFTDDQMLLNYYYKINNDDSKKNVAIDINYNLFWNIPECFFMLNELKKPN